ncbi:hypothetical protein H1R20_g13934, partial [Candolleomyces eurysporus]
MKVPRSNVDEWGVCVNCGNVYEYLEGEVCSVCEDTGIPFYSFYLYTLFDHLLPKDGTLQEARSAVANPVNPRTHTGPDGRVSLSSRVQASELHGDSPADIELQNRALQTLSHMATGYADAVSSAMPGARVAPSKLKSSNTVSRAVKRLNVKISRITDYDNGKYRSGPQFNAISTAYAEDTPITEVIEEVRIVTDNAYTKHRQYRVDLNDFTLLWTASKTTVNPDWLKGTLGDVWRRAHANTLCVSTTDAKRSVLDLHVVVYYNPTGAEDDGEYESKTYTKKVEHVTTRKGKRANSVVAADLHAQTALSSTVKKPRVLPAGKNAYATTLSRSGGTTYIVKRGTYAADKDNSFIWVEEEEVLKAVVEKNSFASGKMKNSYKMLIAGISYAAKSFYNIVAEGPLKGHAWLVDPLLSTDPGVTRKFSGTETAGRNEDLVGIDTAMLPMTSRKAETSAQGLVLFDLMIHSSSESYGHGDQGWEGLEDFVDQHRCNSICTLLGLPSVDDIRSGLEAKEDGHTTRVSKSPSPSSSTHTSPNLEGMHSMHKNPIGDDLDTDE